MLTKVNEHSHLAIDVNLVDKVDEEVSTPYGELRKTELEDDVKFLKPKSNKNDKEFLNQIAYLQSLIKLVSNFTCFHVTFVNDKLIYSSLKRRKGQQL